MSTYIYKYKGKIKINAKIIELFCINYGLKIKNLTIKTLQ